MSFFLSDSFRCVGKQFGLSLYLVCIMPFAEEPSGVPAF